jgi:hypothetical protein
MAFCWHTNDVVRTQEGNRDGKFPMILGAFVEKDYGKTFEYCERRKNLDIFPEYPHTIAVGGQAEMRYAKILGTVAYVVVNENPDGTPVVDKWHIKNHRKYDTDWVLAGL